MSHSDFFNTLSTLNPLDFGFSDSHLGYNSPDQSYRDILKIYSPNLTYGFIEGELQEEYIEDTLALFDRNLRTLYQNNGQQGICHIVDYTDLPKPTAKIQKVSKQYFDTWFNEGILIHQAIIGMPITYRAIAKILNVLNPNIKRSLHNDWESAFSYVFAKIDHLTPSGQAATIDPPNFSTETIETHSNSPSHPDLGTITPFLQGCFESITQRGSIQIYHVRDNLFYTTAKGALETQDIERYIQAQLLIPQQFNLDEFLLINNSPELTEISLKSRKALSEFVKSPNYPFKKVWVINHGLPKVALQVFRALNSTLRERVAVVDSVQEALSQVNQAQKNDLQEEIVFNGKNSKEQLQDAQRQIQELKQIRESNIQNLMGIIGQLGWEEPSGSIDFPDNLHQNPYKPIYETLKLIQEDIFAIQSERSIYLEEILEQKKLAEEAVRTKSEFLSTMSHEIRTPMNAIIGLTDILMDESPTTKQLTYLETLQFSGKNLLNLINDILDFNKIEATKLTLEKTPFLIHQMLDSIYRSLEPMAKQKSIGLDFNLASLSQNLTLKSDPTRLTQILINIITNAIKFTEKGQVTLQVKQEIQSDNQSILRFTIQDTGIGIPEEDIRKIWGQFTQVDASHARRFGGSGLGLAIAKRLIDKFNGLVDVESQLDQGTQFHIQIPFETTQTLESLQKKVHTKVGARLKGVNILIVDDNKINLKVAQKHLEAMEVQTKVALSGQEAITLCQSQTFDMILMDLQMPHMDGFEATIHIHKIQPHTKILALTADIFPEIKVKVEESSMVSYLTKPIKRVDLYNELVYVHSL